MVALLVLNQCQRRLLSILDSHGGLTDAHQTAQKWLIYAVEKKKQLVAGVRATSNHVPESWCPQFESCSNCANNRRIVCG